MRGRGAKKTSVGGKLGISLFLSIFLLAGLVGTYFLGREILIDIDTLKWTSHRCTVESSEVVDSQSESNEFALQVRYSYEFEGRFFRSSQVKRSSASFESYSEAYERSLEFPSGGIVECFINPADSSEVILLHESPWKVFLIFLPLIFVLIGGGGIYATWFLSGSSDSRLEKGKLSKSRSDSKRAGMAGVIIGGIFLLVGLGLIYPLGVKPVMAILQAKTWVETECLVERSWIKRYEGDSDSGPTYKARVLFSYSFEDRRYKADRKSFFPESSGSYSGAAKEKKAYGKGTRFTCYVNPDKPHQAVIDKGFSLFALFSLIPFLFALIGGAVAWHSFKSRKDGRTSSSFGEEPLTGNKVSSSGGDIALRPRSTPLAKSVGTFIVGCFWTGISLIIWFNVDDLFGTIFLSLFVLVGIAILFGAVYLFLADSNLRPVIEIDSPELCLGERYRLRWRLERPKRKVLFPIKHPKVVKIRVEAEEQATYQRGTDTVTAKNKILDEDIIDEQSLFAQNGEVDFEIPTGLMHSFAANRNKIVWRLIIHAEVDRWPDINETFEIEVLPHKKKEEFGFDL